MSASGPNKRMMPVRALVIAVVLKTDVEANGENGERIVLRNPS